MEGTPSNLPEQPAEPSTGGRRPWLYVALAVVLAAAAASAVLLIGGGDEAEGRTVRFQKPTEPGPDPFTKPADVRGERKVSVGSGPFGGTGSDLVCDRELLIRSLRARPDRLRAWAQVAGVDPTARAVARYIRSLRPVTLTRDTRVTNTSYADGRTVRFQALLQAGTAVLVDDKGIPVARCRCGNPLTEPIHYPEATCIACPPDYKPPPPCERYRDCYRRYPDPPPVKGATDFGLPASPDDRPPPEESPPPEASPPDDDSGLAEPREPEGATGPPTASFSPPAGSVSDTYTISFANFPPGEPVNIHLTRPDGAEEDYTAQADGSGSGSFTFPRVADAIPGTYDAVVTNGPVLAPAQVTVREGG